MKRRLPTLVATGFALIVAIALALISVFVERVGPELLQYGNLCGATGSDPCYELVLKGGFPLAYLFDAPGVSVEHQLSFVEDNLVVGAFVVDVAIYFIISMLVAVFVSRHRACLTGITDRAKS